MQVENFYGKLRQQYQEEFPFVVYREPQSKGNIPVRALLQNDDTLYEVFDYTESGFILAPFDEEEKTVLIPDSDSEKLVLQAQMQEDVVTNGKPENVNRANHKIALPEDKEDHLRRIEKAVSVLREGKMQKVVLSRKEEQSIEGKHPLEIFQKLLTSYPTAFVYCWYHPKIGLWLGATPETLLSIEGLNYKTMALAGTQKFSGSMEVKWGEKEKQEQQYVTDAILENLKSLKLSEGMNVSVPYTSKAGTLLHLKTDISGRLNSVGNLKEIIHSLHPTPAVCGLPKEKAKQFILKEEGYRREFYTGFLGEFNVQEKRSRSRNRRNVENLAYSVVKKKTSLFVNLRCMKLEKGVAHLYVGGGITKDSVPEDEWQETRNKAQTMRKVLSEY